MERGVGEGPVGGVHPVRAGILVLHVEEPEAGAAGEHDDRELHEEQPFLHAVPALSFTDGLRATRLKVYDEATDRMVTWKQARTAAT